MRTFLRIGQALIFLLIFILPVFSQAGAPGKEKTPAWVVYERGLDAFRNRDYGEALVAVKRLTEEFGEIPEASFLQGRIYAVEGEYALAEKFFKRALEQRRQLYVLEDRYAILYELASIYSIQKKYRDYEGILLEIVKDQDTFSSARFSRLRDSFVKTLTDEGFEALVNLYRLKNDFAQRANHDLGILYCRTGRSYQAVLHLTLACLAVTSTLADELKAHDTDYRFAGMRDLLKKSGERSYLRDFVGDTRFLEGLYYLGSSLYIHGVPSEAAFLWKIVQEFSRGDLKIQSANQLKSPRPEPLIGY